MSKLIFIPVSIGGGLLAGLIGKKLFGVIWGAIDDQEAPERRAPRGQRAQAGRRPSDRRSSVLPDQGLGRPRVTPRVRACHRRLARRRKPGASVRPPVSNHPRSTHLRRDRDTPSDLARPVRDGDIRDEVDYALAELAGRTGRERKARLTTRTVEALRVASAAARQAARFPSNQRDGSQGGSGR